MDMNKIIQLFFVICWKYEKGRQYILQLCIMLESSKLHMHNLLKSLDAFDRNGVRTSNELLLNFLLKMLKSFNLTNNDTM